MSEEVLKVQIQYTGKDGTNLKREVEIAYNDDLRAVAARFCGDNGKT